MRLPRIIIRINDNGPGYNPKAVTKGLGSSLIEALVRQLEGEYGYTLVAGTEFSLDIPVDDVSRDVDRKESDL